MTANFLVYSCSRQRAWSQLQRSYFLSDGSRLGGSEKSCELEGASPGFALIKELIDTSKSNVPAAITSAETSVDFLELPFSSPSLCFRRQRFWIFGFWTPALYHATSPLPYVNWPGSFQLSLRVTASHYACLLASVSLLIFLLPRDLLKLSSLLSLDPPDGRFTWKTVS